MAIWVWWDLLRWLQSIGFWKDFRPAGLRAGKSPGATEGTADPAATSGWGGKEMERAFSVEFDDFAVCEDRFAMVLSPLPSHSVRIFQLLLTLDVNLGVVFGQCCKVTQTFCMDATHVLKHQTGSSVPWRVTTKRSLGGGSRQRRASGLITQWACQRAWI